MKALSRNTVTATILGREGLIPVLIEIIAKLSETTFGPKLRVAVEVLAGLTKASKIFDSSGWVRGCQIFIGRAYQNIEK
jgi:hypothetical protein